MDPLDAAYESSRAAFEAKASDPSLDLSFWVGEVAQPFAELADSDWSAYLEWVGGDPVQDDNHLLLAAQWCVAALWQDRYGIGPDAPPIPIVC